MRIERERERAENKRSKSLCTSRFLHQQFSILFGDAKFIFAWKIIAKQAFHLFLIQLGTVSRFKRQERDCSLNRLDDQSSQKVVMFGSRCFSCQVVAMAQEQASEFRI